MGETNGVLPTTLPAMLSSKSGVLQRTIRYPGCICRDTGSSSSTIRSWERG
ncbi:MAG: hypothetical protein RL685_106 [Pseudomonadota bacterium]|jgi:hypothetical protein